MTVEPTSRGQIQPSRTSKPKDAVAEQQPDAKPNEAAKLPNAVVDKVEFSSTAQELHELIGSEQMDTSTIPADRLKEILERVSDGTYDRPEIIEEIARRIADEI